MVSAKWEATNFCKCICFSNYTILHIQIPDNPAKPCLTCTKTFCLSQNLPICAGAKVPDANPDTATGKEGDVEARCFQRDSPRDQFVVTIFLLLVFGLLLVAGIKSRMMKAGFDPNVAWNSSRKWWQTWVPQRQQEVYTLASQTPGRASDSGFSRSRERDYVSIPPTG